MTKIRECRLHTDTCQVCAKTSPKTECGRLRAEKFKALTYAYPPRHKENAKEEQENIEETMCWKKVALRNKHITSAKKSNIDTFIKIYQ